MFRLLTGFLLAPGLPAFVLYILNFLLFHEYEAKMLGVILAIISYSAAFFVGIPTYLFLNRRKLESYLAYCAAGAFIGSISYSFFFLLASYGSFIDRINYLVSNIFGSGMLAIIYSISATTVFWLIVVYKYDRK